MALAPDACGRNNQNTRYPDATKMVSCEKGSVHKGDLLVVGDRDGVSGHDGTERCAEHGDEGQNAEDNVAAP